MSEGKIKRSPGRPAGSDGKPTSRLQSRIDEKIFARLEQAYPDAHKRKQIIEQALTLFLDINEGKRRFPDLISTSD